MSGGDESGALRDVRILFSSGTLAELTDRQLLERFANRTDRAAEDAFRILLERHGPMVWGVCCRQLLPDQSAAADAYQATFLVLVRRASAVRVDDSLGPWLYGVSRRVAARARATTLRRRAREAGGAENVAAPAADPDRAEWLKILDEEIGRLPEHQRTAVVLCDLEGLPHEEAARRLGCPVGTVESRLSRGRQRLRDRLVRRGLAPAAAAAWAESARSATAALPATLVEHSARLLSNSPAAGTVPVAVTALAEGVIQMMWLARLKPLVAVAAALMIVTAGVAVQGRQQPASGSAQQQVKGAPTPAIVDGGGARAAAPDAAANQALAKAQLELIDNALEILRRMAQNATVSLSDPRFSLWERRKLDTLRKSGAGKAQMVAQLEKYVEIVKGDEAKAVAAHHAAQGTMVEVYDARFRRMEGEIWLNEEKNR